MTRYIERIVDLICQGMTLEAAEAQAQKEMA